MTPSARRNKDVKLSSLLPVRARDRHVSLRVRTDKKMNHLIKAALSSLRVSTSGSYSVVVRTKLTGRSALAGARMTPTRR